VETHLLELEEEKPKALRQYCDENFNSPGGHSGRLSTWRRT